MFKVRYLVLIILIVVASTATYSLFFQKPKESIKVISYNCDKDKTAFDLLSSSYKIETKDTDFGKMVTSIEGSKPTDKEFWAFYINGKMSKVGAGSYKLKDGDKIEWKIENY